MTEDLRQQDEDIRFERWLRDSLRSAHPAAGWCPDPAMLMNYSAGRLSDAEAQLVAEHILLCGLCECWLHRITERLGALPTDSPLPDVLQLPEVGLEGERRTQRSDREVASGSGRVVESSAPSKNSISGFLKAFLQHPALAYFLVLVLAYPAYLGITLILNNQPAHRLPAPIETVSVPEPIRSVRVLYLDVTRDAESGLPTLEAPAGDDTFVLSFFVPAKPGHHYSIRINDSSGKVVATMSNMPGPDGSGNVHILCERKEFAPGTYALTITDTTSPSEASNPVVYRFKL